MHFAAVILMAVVNPPHREVFNLIIEKLHEQDSVLLSHWVVLLLSLVSHPGISDA